MRRKGTTFFCNSQDFSFFKLKKICFQMLFPSFLYSVSTYYHRKDTHCDNKLIKKQCGAS